MLEELQDNDIVVIYGRDEIRVSRGREWSLPRYTGRTCVRCGNPLTKDRWSNHCPLCGQCHSFHDVSYIGIYHRDLENDLRTGIYGLKNGSRFWTDAIGLALSMVLVNEIPYQMGHPVLVAVPTHELDHPERDYHPPDGLARRIAMHTSAVYKPDILVKSSPSEQKSIEDSSERFRQVENKYDAMRTLNGEQVYLVDDVMTTGATVSTCARCCLEAGAKEVHVLVVGRNYQFLEDREYG